MFLHNRTFINSLVLTSWVSEAAVRRCLGSFGQRRDTKFDWKDHSCFSSDVSSADFFSLIELSKKES